MIPFDATTIAQYASTVVLALLFIAFSIQKFLSAWKTDKTESSVTTLMHTELERMSTQNTTLSIAVGKLNEEVIRLNSELRNLTLENQRLHVEVVALTSEVSRLQTLLKNGGQK